MNGIEQPFWVIVNKEIRDHAHLLGSLVYITDQYA